MVKKRKSGKNSCGKKIVLPVTDYFLLSSRSENRYISEMIDSTSVIDWHLMKHVCSKREISLD